MIDTRFAAITTFLMLGAGLSFPARASAQDVAAIALPDAPGVAAANPVSRTIPDAPAISSSSTNLLGDDDAATTPAVGPTGRTAGPFQKIIQPGEKAPQLTVFDKTLLGLRHAISPFSASGWLVSASWEQITNGSPNYGQTFKGYTQRLGAASARGVSQSVFSDAILASALHQDPRYYRRGRSVKFVKRFAYAGTRVIFTRTNGGIQTVNFSLLGGDLAGATLTQLYYPPLNRNFSEVAKTFANSVGRGALSFEVIEFAPDVLQFLHLKRHE